MSNEITHSKTETKKQRFEAQPQPAETARTDAKKDTVKKLDPTEVESRLRSLPGWTLEGGKLHRKFHFANFVEAFAFMTKVARVAEEQAHHPEWFNAYDVVNVHLSTHDAGGISERDFQLAAAMNARYA
jgi:4a-hydroxytetrahydrobiopterin dehydratase